MTPETIRGYIANAHESLRFYIGMARKYPRNAERFRRDARIHLRRGIFWLDQLRLERDRMEAAE